VAEAYGVLLDSLSDVALRNAQKFVSAGLGRLAVFQVVETIAERFIDGQPVVDTDEKGTKPVEITFRIDGVSPPPTIGPKGPTN
jgi:hypothetical protein